MPDPRTLPLARMSCAFASALALAALLPVQRAAACGGFFCSTQPVLQAGEEVVYALQADGTVVMSVRIDYSGDDEDFAWIVPVPVVPELGVGTDALFDALDAPTRPTFTTNRLTRGTCRSSPICVERSSCDSVGGGCGGSTPGPTFSGPLGPRPVFDAGAASSPDASAPDASTVEVYSETTVGAYETVVLGASTGAEVVRWLREHDYQIPAGSEPLLETYAAQGQKFVALRLAPQGNLIRRTHPLTLRMNTAEACLPIRLTAIATTPDMPITAYFLSESRVTPVNYSSADIDLTEPLLYGFGGAQAYRTRVAEAVDALGGRAFLTEYAGATPDAMAAAIPEYGAVDDLAEETNFGELIIALVERGYALEGDMLALLERYMTAPADRTPEIFYACVQRRVYCGVPTHFDAPGLVAAIESNLRGPANEARALLANRPYTTRLFTTMDAAEMTVDPFFVEDPDLSPVSSQHVADYVALCSADYLAQDVPTQWEIGGAVYPDREGSMSTDQSYCASLGGVPSSEAPSCSEPSSGGGICTAAGVMPMQGGVLGGLLLMFLVRRRRRARLG